MNRLRDRVVIPIPDDVTVADLDRAFAVKTRVDTDDRAAHRVIAEAKRVTLHAAAAGGPYKVSWWISGGQVGSSVSVRMKPRRDGRSLECRTRVATWSWIAALLLLLAALCLLVAVGVLCGRGSDGPSWTGGILALAATALFASWSYLTLPNHSSNVEECQKAALEALTHIRGYRDRE